MRLLIFLNRVPVPELDIVFAEGVRASAAMAVQSAARLAGADWCFFTAVVDVFDQSLWPRMALPSVSDVGPACLICRLGCTAERVSACLGLVYAGAAHSLCWPDVLGCKRSRAHRPRERDHAEPGGAARRLRSRTCCCVHGQAAPG
jgi:hypothetical protein